MLPAVQVGIARYARRRSRGLLEGEYGSIFKGRSMDFEDLREYVPGDDIADLDWKATARSAYPLVKRFVAVRKHTVLLVVGTGVGMTALADVDRGAYQAGGNQAGGNQVAGDQAADGPAKDDVALLVAGVLGLVALRHGDLVALVAGDRQGCEYLPPRGSSTGLEQALRAIQRRCRAPRGMPRGSEGLRPPLEYVVRAVRRRCILVLIGDQDLLGPDELRLLRRLVAQHEVLYVCIGDLAPSEPALTGRAAYDVGTRRSLPRFLAGDRRLLREYHQAREQRWAATSTALSRLGISCERLDAGRDVVPAVFRLLERHRRARRG